MLITYKQWKERQKQEIPQTEFVQCFECDGDGEINGKCECCGHESEKECSQCEGQGKLLWASLRDSDKDRFLTFSRYMTVALEECRLLAQWRCKNEIQQAWELGLAPFQYKDSKTIHYMHHSVAEI